MLKFEIIIISIKEIIDDIYQSAQFLHYNKNYLFSRQSQQEDTLFRSQRSHFRCTSPLQLQSKAKDRKSSFR